MAIFAKVVTNTDVERRLSVSDGCVPFLTCFHGVKDDEGNVWNIFFTIRSGVFPKPVILSRRIHEQGDIVMVYREDDMIIKSQYKIEVKKRSPKMSARHTFQKELSKTDMGVRLSLQVKFPNTFEFPEGKDKVEFVVTDVRSDKPRTFVLSKRKKILELAPKASCVSRLVSICSSKAIGSEGTAHAIRKEVGWLG